MRPAHALIAYYNAHAYSDACARMISISASARRCSVTTMKALLFINVLLGQGLLSLTEIQRFSYSLQTAEQNVPVRSNVQ